MYALLEVGRHPVLVEPTDLVKSSPQLGCFININLAGLLRIRLTKFFPGVEALKTSNEHPSLAREISCAIKSKVGSERNLIRMQEIAMWVVAQIDGSSLPVHLETIRLVRE